jgi:uncharacterized protein (TIGR04255 family)
MAMERNCPSIPLSKQPLVLVLCQVRFSKVRQMGHFIAAIQEEFRRNGYPIEKAGKVQQVLITPTGLQQAEQPSWEYRTMDESRSILVLEDSVTFQTTSYARFEEFAEQLRFALATVLAKAEHDKFGVIHRIGLRYIDLIRPDAGKDYRFFLKPGFHGVAEAVFEAGTHRVHVQSVGRTMVDGAPGAMIVRVSQSDAGFDLPPDLALGAPKHVVRATKGEVVTFVDMDHSITGKFAADVGLAVEKLYRLHDKLIETFHEQVVTKEAIESWK